MIRTKLAAAALGAVLSLAAVTPSFAATGASQTSTQSAAPQGATKTAVRHHRRQHHAANNVKPASSTTSTTQGASTKKN